MMRFFAFTILLFSIFMLSFRSKTTRVVFFGDSITQAGVQPGGYIAQINDSLVQKNKAPEYELIGAGIGGNKVYDLFLRLEPDVLVLKARSEEAHV